MSLTQPQKTSSWGEGCPPLIYSIFVLSLSQFGTWAIPNTPPHAQHFWAWWVTHLYESRIVFDTILAKHVGLGLTQPHKLGEGPPPHIFYLCFISSQCGTWIFPNSTTLSSIIILFINSFLQIFCSLSGTVFMPPKWSLGYHQCHSRYLSDERVLEVLGVFSVG